MKENGHSTILIKSGPNYQARSAIPDQGLARVNFYYHLICIYPESCYWMEFKAEFAELISQFFILLMVGKTRDRMLP